MCSYARYLCLALFALPLGCVVTDVGNPPDKPTISAALQFELDAGEQPAFELDRAWLSFVRVRMIEQDDCTDEAKVDAPNPDPFEVLTWRRPSQPLVLTGQGSELCRVGMVFEPFAAFTLPDGAPAGSVGSSLVVLGVIPETQGRRLVISLDLTQKLKLDALGQGSFSLPVRDRIHELLVSIDTTGWVTTEALQNADVAEDGQVHIDAENNRPLYDAIMRELKECVNVVVDEDGDGEFGEQERAAPVAQGGIVEP